MGPTPISLYDPDLIRGTRTTPSIGEVAVEMLTEMYIEGDIEFEEFDNRVGYALEQGEGQRYGYA